MDPLPPFPWFDLAIIVALFVLNGVFAMSELAVVSARRARLEAMMRAGKRGAASALQLAADPGRFLSTVQIGITLIGILSGAYSGASLGGPVGARLGALGVPDAYAQEVGFALVIALTTYFSLVVGELVPKQFALRNPEAIAALVAVPMQVLAKVGAPVVWLLDGTTSVVFRLLGLKRDAEDTVTAEELQMIVAEASRSGVIEEHERRVISGVVRLADRPVREVMTPRTAIDWIDIDAEEATVRAKLIETPHTRLLVAEGAIDQVAGVVQARDVAAALAAGEPLALRTLMRPAQVVPDQIDAMDALVTLRRSEVPMALVQDEYGHIEGIVTPNDLLAAIAGDFRSDQDAGEQPGIVMREDGSLLVSGSHSADQLAERLGLDLPEDRDYATVAGLALAVLKKLPSEGEHFTEQGWRFEVVDMDGRKIDKLLISEAG